MNLQLIKEALINYFGSESEVKLWDETHLHSGHSGSKIHGGGHYKLQLISDKFQGLSRVQRHKLVYDVLDSFFKNKIHALSISTLTFNEYEK